MKTNPWGFTNENVAMRYSTLFLQHALDGLWFAARGGLNTLGTQRQTSQRYKTKKLNSANPSTQTRRRQSANEAGHRSNCGKPDRKNQAPTEIYPQTKENQMCVVCVLFV